MSDQFMDNDIVIQQIHCDGVKQMKREEKKDLYFK